MNILDRIKLGFGESIPCVLQTEAAECGLACLTMIANHYGAQTDLGELRRRFGFSLKGATLKDIVGIADFIGFAARPVRLELEELCELATPCILHWDLNHFVVLTRVDSNGVTINDPAIGARVMSLKAASDHFTGVALELSPTDRLESAVERPRLRMRQLIGRIAGVRRALLQLFGMAFALELFAMISPFFMAWVVDQALVAADRDLLTTLALSFGLLLIMQTAIRTMRSWMLMGFNVSMRVQSRANLFSHLVNLPASFFEARHLGDVMSRFASQDTILQAVTNEVVEAILDGVMALVTLVVMFVFSPVLTFVALLGSALYGLLRWLSYTPLRQASMEAIVWGARRDSHFLETLRGIRTIKLFNGQEERRSRWLNLSVETVNRQLDGEKLRLLFQTSNAILLGIMNIAIVWIGANRVLDGAFSIGLLIAFLAYKDQFLGRITALINRVVDLTMLRLHADRLSDLALTEPEPRDDRRLLPISKKPCRIELRKVRFRYGANEPWLLDGVSCVIDARDFVAVVGPSGGGKTTLLKLLAGLLTPTEGQILIDGKPLNQIGLERYRSMLGVVMQDDQLFAGSIADNISFFAERPDFAAIAECARLASVDDDIRNMSMGYDTLIGDMGTVLSGGQKQRIIIARALYRQPGILLFDEATSHLDVARERAVNESLNGLDLTRIVIAHRPETIRAAQRVLELSGGKLIEKRDSLRNSSIPSLRKARINHASA